MDSVFEHLDAKAHCLQQELDAATSPITYDIAAGVQLRQFPKVFRPALSDLLGALPINISVGKRSYQGAKATGLLSDRRPSSDYASYQCAFKQPDSTDNCLTWTHIPYVTETYFAGLARVLTAAADTELLDIELEMELSRGLQAMFCHRHDQLDKDSQVSSLAAKSRDIIDQWRANEHKWRDIGKRTVDQAASAAKQERAPVGGSGGRMPRRGHPHDHLGGKIRSDTGNKDAAASPERDDSDVWSSSGSSTQSSWADREMESLRQQNQYLRDENHRLRTEAMDLSDQYLHEH